MRANDLIPPPKPGPAEMPPRSRDPDLSSYFLVRRRTAESDAVSPTFGPSRTLSYQKSPQSNSHKSEGYSRGPRTKANSITSGRSARSRNRHISDWNDSSIGLTTPSSFDCHLRHSVDPPRPAGEGLEWVWFPEGYWAEREIRDNPAKKQVSRQKWWNRSPGRKSKSLEKLGNTEASTKSNALADVPRIQIGSLVSSMSRKPSATKIPKKNQSSVTSRKSSGNATAQNKTNLLGGQDKIPVPPDYAIAPVEQLGLYCRTKKTIQTRFMQKTTATDDASIADVEKLTSRTTMLLQGTSSYLNRVQRERCQPSGQYISSEAPRTPGSSSGRSSRRFGLAPWHRRSSHESILSASSSVFKLLLGKAPAATPNPDHQYEGNDGRSYPTVDISSPDPLEPNFLPSEAKRINTPPTFPGTPAVQARGFFFDLTSPRDDNTSGSTGSSIVAKNRSNGTSPAVEWWEADTQHASTGNKSARPLNSDSTTAHATSSSFQLNLPEHLPNSPLCPKNPKQKSGGTGICPYHGRKRSMNLRNVERTNSHERAMPTLLRSSTGNLL